MQAVSVIFWLGGLVGIIDAAIHPASAWAQADRRKPFWIILMVFTGSIGALVYIFAVRSRFNRARTSDEFLK